MNIHPVFLHRVAVAMMIFSLSLHLQEVQASPPFSKLTSSLKVETLLNMNLQELDLLSRQSKAIRELILSDSFYLRGQRIWSVNQKVFFPMFRILKELSGLSDPSRPNPVALAKVRDLAWRKKQVQLLLSPSSQFSEIPSGWFLMGDSFHPRDPDFEYLDFAYEQPHWVYLGFPHSRIHIQRTSVTQLLWFLVMGTNPSTFNQRENCPEDFLQVDGVSLCPLHPVEGVSWNQIAETENSENLEIPKIQKIYKPKTYKKDTFLRRLKDDFGIQARLPTEAERERAMRGAVKNPYFYYPFSFGHIGKLHSNLAKHAWFDSNSNEQTHRVGQKEWNSLAVADLNGNVGEWVEDWFAPNYWEKCNPCLNPQGPDRPIIFEYRGIRGGSWRSRLPSSLSSSYRYFYPAEEGFYEVGFRLAIETQ